MHAETDPKVLRDLRGIGPKIEAALNRLGIYKIRDLLFHLPYRYEDRTRRSNLCDVKTGFPQLFEGRFASHRVLSGRRIQALLIFEDEHGEALVRLFHFSRPYLATLTRATRVRIFGEPRVGSTKVEFVHPEITILNSDPLPLEDKLTPIYSISQGITQPRIRDVIQQALALGPSAYELHELLGDTFTSGRPSVWEALFELHQPSKQKPARAFVERLAFEELVAHRLLLLSRRDEYAQFSAPLLTNNGITYLQQSLINSLSFQLTSAQLKVISEIELDLQSKKPIA